MNRIKQKSTWLGISTIIMAVLGAFTGAIDGASVGPMLVNGFGLVVVDA